MAVCTVTEICQFVQETKKELQVGLHCSSRGKMRSALLALLLVAVGVIMTLLLNQQIHEANLHAYSLKRGSIRANKTYRAQEQLAMDTEMTTSSSCVPKKKFVFIKTHKTGGCTAINIFQRFAIYHKLKVLMPVGQGALGGPSPPREEDYVHTPDEKYDALMHHLGYNKTWLLTKFPPETPYISILREPYSHLKSQMNYFRLPNFLGIRSSNPIKTFLKDPWKYRKKSEAFFVHANLSWDGTRNPMAFDMGWPAEKADNEEEAHTYIRKLDTEFTLVMILEHLDESVVMLRRLMCWEVKDVVLYSRIENQRQYSYKRYVATPKELENHRRWSAVDYMLYETFNKSLWQKIDAQGPDFYEELRYFRTIRNNISRHCARTMKECKNETLVIAASEWSPQFVVDYTYCSYITAWKVYELDVVMRGREYTREELGHSLLNQKTNLRLMKKGLPTFANRHDFDAAGIRVPHKAPLRRPESLEDIIHKTLKASMFLA